MVPTRLMQTTSIGKLVAFDCETGSLLLVHPEQFYVQSNPSPQSIKEINEIICSQNHDGIIWHVPFSREIQQFESYVISIYPSLRVSEFGEGDVWIQTADRPFGRGISQVLIMNDNKIMYGYTTSKFGSGNLILITRCDGSNCERY